MDQRRMDGTRAGRPPAHSESRDARDRRRSGGRERGGRRARVRGRSRGPDTLAPCAGARARQAAARGGADDAWRSRAPVGAAHARGREAAHREPRRGRVVRRVLRLLRGDRQALARQLDPADGRAPDQLHDQGAARRCGRDRAVQLSTAVARLEDRAGARRR